MTNAVDVQADVCKKTIKHLNLPSLEEVRLDIAHALNHAGIRLSVYEIYTFSPSDYVANYEATLTDYEGKLESLTFSFFGIVNTKTNDLDVDVNVRLHPKWFSSEESMIAFFRHMRHNLRFYITRIA